MELELTTKSKLTRTQVQLSKAHIHESAIVHLAWTHNDSTLQFKQKQNGFLI